MAYDSLDGAALRFDHAAAERAADACERAARLLRDTTTRRAALAGRALESGHGPWRDVLTRRIAAVQRSATEIEAELRALAGALRDASARAIVDQAHLDAANRAAAVATAAASGAQNRNVGHLATRPVPR